MRALFLASSLTVVAATAVACGDSSTTSPSRSTTSTTTTTTTTAGTGGMGGMGGGTTTSATGGTTSAGGQGGTGGGEEPWPTCETKPDDVDLITIPQIWQNDPTAPSEVWVSGAIVTAVSFGGCSDGFPCEIFLQDAPGYANFAAGAQHGIKLFASAATAGYFEGIAPGDVVDTLAHAWRYDVDGKNELLLQVNLQLPGCARATGTGTPIPITGVTLDQLTKDAYENTHGPLLVQVATVSGMPTNNDETFGLWETGTINQGDIVSLSPYFLPNGAFSNLVLGGILDFSSVTGVFGIFIPDAQSPTFLHIYPRTMADVVQAN